MSRTFLALLNDLLTDARQAVRQMRRSPVFALMVLTALGLGIGATVALVSVVDSLLVRPLPYRNEQSVRVFSQDNTWTDEEFDFLRDRTRVFATLAVYSTEHVRG
ncbi:MAG TPA: hypothetical protein VGM67_13400 [Gemmatimonadaceae bacterium]|jgi:hypothetical protein